jgi:hypothetical protein
VEESEYIELKLAISAALAKRRKKKQFDIGTVSQDAEIQSVKDRQNGKRRSDRICGSSRKIIAGYGCQ